jgi:capreomycidine synthase
MHLPAAPLEDWLRDYYFEAAVDISSSGVEPYSMEELRQLVGLSDDEIVGVTLHDSPSRGDRRLRATIAERWGDDDPERVLVTNGSNEALFLVLTALLDEGDEVLVPEPAYHSLAALAEARGCVVRLWPLRPEAAFQPDLDELEALVSNTTRAVVANFPHNPTGASLTEAGYARLLDTVSRVGAWLVWDAVFADLTYDRPPLPDPSCAYERAVSFGTLSKCYGLPGLRVGWALGPPDVLRDAVRVRDYTSLATSPLVEAVAYRAVEGADALLAPRLDQARRNLTLVRAWMTEHTEAVEWAPPDGGVVVFPRLHDFADTEALCHQLMAEAGVLVVPGTCFGHPSHVRLGFGGSTTALTEGLDRLSTALTTH